MVLKDRNKVFTLYRRPIDKYIFYSKEISPERRPLLDMGLPQASVHRPVLCSHSVYTRDYHRSSFKLVGGLAVMINNKKMKSFSEDREVNLRSRANSVKSKERHAAKNNAMSTDTKGFIQKLCYRKTASIDMTQYGFISDSKVNPVKYMIKPLREQLEKICVKSTSVKHRQTSPTPPRFKAFEVVSPAERKPKPYVPKSAMSYPGTRSSRTRFRKVRIQNDPGPVPAVIKEKKVRLVSPRRSRGENVGSKNNVRQRKMNLIK